MFINFWYPMAASDELTDKPLKVRCMGLDFVLFRDSAGAAHCLINTCIHRGGSLAGGKVIGDCIQCPYHGWQFDADGKCQKIPSLGKGARVPGRARADAYDVREAYGIVFAFLGDLPAAERPPLLEVREAGQEGWRLTMQHYRLESNYQRSIENGLDPAHNEFVHDTHGYQGEDEEYKLNEMRIEESSNWGKGFWHTFNAPELPEGQMRNLRDFAGDLEAGTGYHGPNQLWTYIHVSPENWIHQYGWERPIDDETSYIYLVTARNCALDSDKDDYIKERNWYVAQQDITVVEALRPVVTPETNTKELMTPADQVILMYREQLKEWENRGWMIDFERVECDSRKIAYAIAGNARRAQKGWVLDVVPTTVGSAAAQEKLKATG